jgi:hypothetical protein
MRDMTTHIAEPFQLAPFEDARNPRGNFAHLRLDREIQVDFQRVGSRSGATVARSRFAVANLSCSADWHTWTSHAWHPLHQSGKRSGGRPRAAKMARCNTAPRRQASVNNRSTNRVNSAHFGTPASSAVREFQGQKRVDPSKSRRLLEATVQPLLSLTELADSRSQYGRGLSTSRRRFSMRFNTSANPQRIL